MKNIRIWIFFSLIAMLSACGDKPGIEVKVADTKAAAVDAENGGKLLRATYSPLHFKPASRQPTAWLGISGQVLIAVIRTLSIGGI